MEELQIKSKLTEKDYRHFYILSNLRRKSILFFVTLLFSFSFLKDSFSIGMSICISLAITFAIIGLYCACCFLFAKRIFKQNIAGQYETTYTFAEENMTVETEILNSKISYDAFVRIRKTKKTLAVYISDNSAILITINDDNRDTVEKIYASLCEKCFKPKNREAGITVYKNSAENEKLFFKRKILRNILIFILILIYLPILWISLNVMFDDAISFICFVLGLAVDFVFLLFPFAIKKRIKNNYYAYSFEIGDDGITVNENNIQKKIGFFEIRAIKKINAKKYKIYTDNFNVYTSEYIENLDGFCAELAKIKTPEPDRFEKIVFALSYFFVIGLFITLVATFAGFYLDIFTDYTINLLVINLILIFFWLGFAVMLLIAIIKNIRRFGMSVFMKIFVSVSYLFLAIMFFLCFGGF